MQWKSYSLKRYNIITFPKVAYNMQKQIKTPLENNIYGINHATFYLFTEWESYSPCIFKVASAMRFEGVKLKL